MSTSPLLTPLTFLCADTSEMCSETGLRGLGSVRRFAFGTLLCPEFPLRSSPRITVRGQTVQGVRLVLRKAPLPSMVCPWSTKRHCGPLAFRRATEGSRVLRKMRGSQEGDKKPFGVLSPFCPRRRAAAMHTPCHGEYPPSREGVFRLQRHTAVPAEGIPSAGAQKGDGKNSELTLAEKGELFYNKINTWEDFL